METGEPLAMPDVHTPEKCPFCPPAKQEPFTTFPGSAALGTTLGNIMKNPSSLEDAARPKDGQPDRQAPSTAKPYPNPPLQHPVYGAYTYEAHHLIPGNEKTLKSEGKKSVMKGHAIEKWICEGPNINGDTGYSINNADNGAWFPSVPVDHKKGPGASPAIPWTAAAKEAKTPGALNQKQKEGIADYAMDHGAGQFHNGKHSLNDKEGADPSYPKVVHGRLTTLNDQLHAWAKVCPNCAMKPQDPPYDPHWFVNELLDRVSKWIEIEIHKMPPVTWKYYLSSHAMRLAKAKRRPTLAAK